MGRLDVWIGCAILVHINAAAHQQAGRHQPVEHRLDPDVLLRRGVFQLAQQHPPPGQLAAAFSRDHAQHHPLHGGPVRVVGQAVILLVGPLAQRADHPAQRLVVCQRQRPIVAAATHIANVHLAQGEGEQRQRARHLDHLVDELIHQFRRLEVKHTHGRRAFDDIAQGSLIHRRDDISNEA